MTIWLIWKILTFREKNYPPDSEYLPFSLKDEIRKFGKGGLAMMLFFILLFIIWLFLEIF